MNAQLVDKILEFFNKVGAPYAIIAAMLYLAHSSFSEIISLLHNIVARQETIMRMIGGLQK